MFFLEIFIHLIGKVNSQSKFHSGICDKSYSGKKKVDSQSKLNSENWSEI